MTNTDNASTRYWCHSCGAETFVSIDSDDDNSKKCEICSSDFVEEMKAEYGEESSIENPADFRAEGASSLSNSSPSSPQVLSSSPESTDNFTSPATYNEHRSTSQRNINRELFGAESNTEGNIDLQRSLATGITNLVNHVVTQIQSNREYGLSSRTPISVYVHNSPFVGPLSAYDLDGRNYDRLLHDLLMNGNSYGKPPPTSRKVIDTLKKNKHIVTEDDKFLHKECAICKDELATGSEILVLECEHPFCEDCILPWLNTHNTCPVCRKEFATDESDIEGTKANSRGERVLSSFHRGSETPSQAHHSGRNSYSPFPFGDDLDGIP